MTYKEFFVSLIIVCLVILTGMCLLITHHAKTEVGETTALYTEAVALQDELIEKQQLKIEKLKFFLSEAFGVEYDSQPVYTKKVTATAYTARPVECNDEPWVTASGRPSRVGGIAVSRDLEAVGLNLGDLVIIKGMGLFRIEDRMNARWTNRIDILHAHLKAARNFAQQDLEIMWLGGNRNT